MADINDLMAHFDKIQADKKQQEAQQQAQQDAEAEKLAADNARVHEVFKTVVMPAITAAKAGLSARNVTLDIRDVLVMGRGHKRHHNGVEFYLCNAGDENRPDRPHTRSYSMYLRDNDAVVVQRRSDEPPVILEDLVETLGRTSVPELTEGYVYDLVKLAIDELTQKEQAPTRRR